MPESRRRITRSWAILMALSLAMALLTDARPQLLLQAILAALLATAVVLKARIILLDYLGLRDHPAIAGAFFWPIAILVVAITASFVLVRLPIAA